MKKNKTIFAVALLSMAATSTAFAISVSVAHVSSVAHVAAAPHVSAAHVAAPSVHVAEPVVTHTAPAAPPVPKVPTPLRLPAQEPKSETYLYPPKVSTIYTPTTKHYAVPRGTMQPFCKDPEAYRTANPIKFSEDEYRGMVDACFRSKQETGDQTQ